MLPSSLGFEIKRQQIEIQQHPYGRIGLIAQLFNLPDVTGVKLLHGITSDKQKNNMLQTGRRYPATASLLD